VDFVVIVFLVLRCEIFLWFFVFDDGGDDEDSNGGDIRGSVDNAVRGGK
jgi:hypothetical protein